MNIDIVNRQVSEKLGVPEKKVALLNKFYWRSVYDHLYSYDQRPLNVENVCVFYVDKRSLKKQILLYIKRIRTIRHSVKFKVYSKLRPIYIEGYKDMIRKLWRLRKEKQYTN